MLADLFCAAHFLLLGNKICPLLSPERDRDKDKHTEQEMAANSTGRKKTNSKRMKAKVRKNLAHIFATIYGWLEAFIETKGPEKRS